MKKLFLLAALACASAAAITVSGDSLVLDERERGLMARCDELGGCAVISRAELVQYIEALRQSWDAEIREAFGQAVKAEAKRVCGNTI
jgi:hypothetical protein